ncbi:MAG: molecular chaperone TorD family protein [Coriobacteriales bacterium]|nr:molecular chaperone TorD family protein [Coriobacteriales bacterium]
MPVLEERFDVVAQTALADWCSLVAYLLQPPTAEVIDQLQQASMGDDLRAIAFELRMTDEATDKLAGDFDELHRELASTPAKEALGTIRREWTRVFVHPKAPIIWPYEGVFCDVERVHAGQKSTESRLFINPAATDAERRYKTAGYVDADMEYPADFIVTELEFLAILHTQLAQALTTNDAQAAEQIKASFDSFWQEHIVNWMPRFFERCQEECHTTNYMLAGRLGEQLIAAEQTIAR